MTWWCPALAEGQPVRLAEWGRHITASLGNQVRQGPDPSLEEHITPLAERQAMLDGLFRAKKGRAEPLS